MQNHRITPPAGNQSPYDRLSAAITEAQVVIVALAMLARIDWQKVFIVTARALAVLAIAFLAYQYAHYFAAFGAGALAFIGQFAIGLFFLVAILQSTNGLQIMTAALGLYLLVNSF